MARFLGINLCRCFSTAARDAASAAFIATVTETSVTWCLRLHAGSHSTSDRCKQCSPAQSRAMLALQLLGAFSVVQLQLLPKTVWAGKVCKEYMHVDASLPSGQQL